MSFYENIPAALYSAGANWLPSLTSRLVGNIYSGFMSGFDINTFGSYSAIATSFITMTTLTIVMPEAWDEDDSLADMALEISIPVAMKTSLAFGAGEMRIASIFTNTITFSGTSYTRNTLRGRWVSPWPTGPTSVALEWRVISGSGTDTIFCDRAAHSTSVVFGNDCYVAPVAE